MLLHRINIPYKLDSESMAIVCSAPKKENSPSWLSICYKKQVVELPYRKTDDCTYYSIMEDIDSTEDMKVKYFINTLNTIQWLFFRK